MVLLSITTGSDGMSSESAPSLLLRVVGRGSVALYHYDV